MTLDQVRSVLAIYEERLQELEADPKRINTGSKKPAEGPALQHAAWMCQEMKSLLEGPAPDEAKIARWLGFVQSILWMTGLFSIDEMRDHNR